MTDTVKPLRRPGWPFAVLLALAALGAGAAAAGGGDAVSDLLERGGLTRADLSVAPRGDSWGSPRGAGVPHRLPHVEALLREPLRLPLFADGFLEAARRFGGDARKLFTAVCIQPRLTGFTRGDGNLFVVTSLAQALDLLKTPVDAPSAGAYLVPGSFGTVEQPLLPPASAEATAEANRLPAPLREPLARLLVALFDADQWVRRAWRRVPPVVARAASHRTGLLEALPDGARFFPDVEDAARDLDAESLAYAALKAVSGVEEASKRLAEAVALCPPEKLVSLRWEVVTPRGRVRVSGTGNDRHVLRGDANLLLLVDLGGDDTYEGPFAAGVWPEQPVAVVLDLSGNDVYTATGDAPAQGAGLGGVGILFDVAGNDRYTADERAQGYGQLGAGVLVDAGGKDEYRLGSAGQGAAIFGAGLLLDRGGDDKYIILHDGQGYGGPGGAGVLVDLSGNDSYEAVRDPARAGRPDPRADGAAAQSNAQGVGIGRRGDGSDGHSWAGGVGALVDVSGNDTYTCGTWCQGTGYWFGTGVLADGAGNDTYDAVWYAQAASAHHALGVLLDVSGDDRYTLSGTGGAGLGFAWDLSAAVFTDLSGNDTYRARRLALGAAMQRSVAVFIDAEGDDHYDVERPELAFGWVDDDPRWATRDPLFPAWFETPQAALFLDLGGSDVYPAGRGAEGAAWGSWEEGRRTVAPRNLAAGLDTTAPLPVELRGLSGAGRPR